MNWPLSQDYNEAIQNPRSSFSDPELREGQVTVNALGLPLPRSGNFADVYEFHCPKHNTRWALKCFTRKVAGLRERYSEISRCLQEARLPFTVAFQYLEQGVRIRGEWYPLLKMRWVQGLLLNEFVRDNLDKPALLQSLGLIWQRMAKRLREVNIAHADLQHGNVLLVPGPNAQSLGVRLIDYDGMFVPALAGKKSGEVGHPNYQHPQRAGKGIYNVEVDRVPLLVVATALRTLSVGGRELWERYDNGDNLLFRESDLRDPSASELFRELKQMPDPLIGMLAARLAEACELRLEDAPLLEELLPEGKPPAKTGVRAARDVKNRLAGQLPEEEAEPTEETEELEVDDWDFEEVPERKKRRKKARKGRRKQPQVAVWKWAAGAAAVVLLLLVGIVIATRGRGDKTDDGAIAENRTETPSKDAGRKTDKQPPKDRQGTPAKDNVKPPDTTVKPPDSGAKPPSGGVQPSEDDPMPVAVEDGPLVPGNRRAVRLLDKPGLRSAVSPDGHVLAVYRSFPVNIDLWDLPNGKALAPINFQPNTTPTGLVFSADGKTLYAACPGSGVHAWDVASRATAGNAQPGEYVLGAGRYRATIERENKVGDFFLHLWRRGSAEEYYRHRLPPVGNRFLSVSRDESRLAFLTDGANLHVLDLKSKTLSKFSVLVERECHAAHISPDGKSVLVSYPKGELRLWDIERQQDLRTFTGHTRLPSVLAFSPGGRWAFSADGRGEVRAWEVSTGGLVATLEGPRQQVMGLVMASSGRLVANSLDGVFMWDLKGTAPSTSPEPAPVVEEGATARRLDGNGGNASSVAFSPDGRLLVTGHDNPQPAIRLWDVVTGKEQRAVTGLRGPARSITFSRDGKKIISGEGDTVFARDGQLGRQGAERLGSGHYVSPGGRHRATVGYNRTRGVLLQIWSQGVTVAKAIPVDDNTNVFLSFSADEARVAFIGRKGTLYVFELATKRTVFKQSMGGGALRPFGAFLSPDGRFVLVSYETGELRLWDVKERKAVHTFRGHTGGVRNAVFSSDGKRIYSGDFEGFVHVWDVAAEKMLGTLKGASRGLGQLALSADGRRLAAVAGDGIYLWDLTSKAGGNGTGGGR